MTVLYWISKACKHDWLWIPVTLQFYVNFKSYYIIHSVRISKSPSTCFTICGTKVVLYYTSASTKYSGFTLSICPSVDRSMSALYRQQYLSDPFHICTSYQTTSEGVSGVMFVSKFEILANSLNLLLWLCLLLTWDPIWLNGMGNHEAAGGILRMQAF